MQWEDHTIRASGRVSVVTHTRAASSPLASPAILCQRLTQILLKTNVLSSGSQSHFRHITALRTSIVIIIELQSSPRVTKADTKVWGKQNNFFQAREISFIKI